MLNTFTVIHDSKIIDVPIVPPVHGSRVVGHVIGMGYDATVIAVHLARPLVAADGAVYAAGDVVAFDLTAVPE